MDMLTALYLGLPVTLTFGAPRPAFPRPDYSPADYCPRCGGDFAFPGTPAGCECTS